MHDYVRHFRWSHINGTFNPIIRKNLTLLVYRQGPSNLYKLRGVTLILDLIPPDFTVYGI